LFYLILKMNTSVYCFYSDRFEGKLEFYILKGRFTWVVYLLTNFYLCRSRNYIKNLRNTYYELHPTILVSIYVFRYKHIIL
jgi:hypothetical protein